MNTKPLLTRIGVPVLSLGLLGGVGATLATSASASTMATTLSASVKPPTATIVASTQVNHVPDTTSGTATEVPSQFGPVWAYDDVTKTFRITPDGGGNYTVTMLVNGTFTAFDEPNTGNLTTFTPLNPNVTGQLHGTNVYHVHSDVAPDPSLLPAQEQDGTGTGAMLNQLFGGNQKDLGGDSGNLWVFSYHAAGGSMTQRYDTAPSTWGNITG